MPLIKSKSKAAFKKNVEKEIKAGKKPDQAVAIAYSVQRNAKPNLSKHSAKPMRKSGRGR